MFRMCGFITLVVTTVRTVCPVQGTHPQSDQKKKNRKRQGQGNLLEEMPGSRPDHQGDDEKK